MAKKKNNKKSNKAQSNGPKHEEYTETSPEPSEAITSSDEVKVGTKEATNSQTGQTVDNGACNDETDTQNSKGELVCESADHGGEENQNGSSVETGVKGRETDDERVKELELKVVELTMKLNQIEDREVKDTKVSHDDEVERLKVTLKNTEEERDKVQVQYEALLSRLGSMKSVFSKMKENQTELEETKEQLEEYEKQNLQLKKKTDTLQKEILDYEKIVSVLKEESESLNAECDRLSDELRALRSELEEKESSWSIERRSLTTTNNNLEKNIEKLKQTNEEYIITLENDKIVNSSLNNDITDLGDKVKDLQDTISRLEREKKSFQTLNQSANEDLKRLQKEFDAATEKHLNSFKSLETELELHRQQYESLKSQNAILVQEVTKVNKLEQEVKEKQLQIGKLRHEAVILNEHLTKALQLIKRNSDAETVDKELVSNLFISFLSFPRGDTKKFEVLQLISNYLNWDEDKRIQAGLAHNATASRTRQARESFVSLWTEYLENESQK